MATRIWLGYTSQVCQRRPKSTDGAVPVLSRDFAEGDNLSLVIIYAVVDEALSPDFPLGVELETLIRREDAEQFINKVRGDDPEVASYCGSRSGSSRRAG